MDYEKTRLTPIIEKKDDAPTSAAIEEARAQLLRHRAETAKYKQKYFEYYDDVKINHRHREDW